MRACEEVGAPPPWPTAVVGAMGPSVRLPDVVGAGWLVKVRLTGTGGFLYQMSNFLHSSIINVANAAWLLRRAAQLLQFSRCSSICETINKIGV